MERFVAAGERAGKRVRFFAVEGVPDPTAAKLRWLQIGKQPAWNPQRWPEGLRTRVRGQLRRARRNRVVDTQLVDPRALQRPEAPLRRGLAALLDEWRDSRGMAPMGFVVHLDPFHRADERLCFVAQRGGTIVGAVIAVPVAGRNGWCLDGMVRGRDAPNGTMEVLVDHAMRHLAKSGCEYVTLGMCPLMDVASPALRLIRSCAKPFYNFEGLQHFKAKLMPDTWQPVYLVHPSSCSPVWGLWDAIAAFLPGGIGRFARDTLLRRLPGVRSLAPAVSPVARIVGLAWRRRQRLSDSAPRSCQTD